VVLGFCECLDIRPQFSIRFAFAHYVK